MTKVTISNALHTCQNASFSVCNTISSGSQSDTPQTDRGLGINTVIYVVDNNICCFLQFSLARRSVLSTITDDSVLRGWLLQRPAGVFQRCSRQNNVVIVAHSPCVLCVRCRRDFPSIIDSNCINIILYHWTNVLSDKRLNKQLPIHLCADVFCSTCSPCGREKSMEERQAVWVLC